MALSLRKLCVVLIHTKTDGPTPDLTVVATDLLADLQLCLDQPLDLDELRDKIRDLKSAVIAERDAKALGPAMALRERTEAELIKMFSNLD